MKNFENADWNDDFHLAKNLNETIGKAYLCCKNVVLK